MTVVDGLQLQLNSSNDWNEKKCEKIYFDRTSLEKSHSSFLPDIACPNGLDECIRDYKLNKYKLKNHRKFDVFEPSNSMFSFESANSTQAKMFLYDSLLHNHFSNSHSNDRINKLNNEHYFLVKEYLSDENLNNPKHERHIKFSNLNTIREDKTQPRQQKAHKQHRKQPINHEQQVTTNHTETDSKLTNAGVTLPPIDQPVENQELNSLIICTRFFTNLAERAKKTKNFVNFNQDSAAKLKKRKKFINIDDSRMSLLERHNLNFKINLAFRHTKLLNNSTRIHSENRALLNSIDLKFPNLEDDPNEHNRHLTDTNYYDSISNRKENLNFTLPKIGLTHRY